MRGHMERIPSPDSDYDVRFLRMRLRNWYRAIDARRDVIGCGARYRALASRFAFNSVSTAPSSR